MAPTSVGRLLANGGACEMAGPAPLPPTSGPAHAHDFTRCALVCVPAPRDLMAHARLRSLGIASGSLAFNATRSRTDVFSYATNQPRIVEHGGGSTRSRTVQFARVSFQGEPDEHAGAAAYWQRLLCQPVRPCRRSRNLMSRRGCSAQAPTSSSPGAPPMLTASSSATMGR